jgi:hypothetical protein
MRAEGVTHDLPERRPPPTVPVLVAIVLAVLGLGGSSAAENGQAEAKLNANHFRVASVAAEFSHVSTIRIDGEVHRKLAESLSPFVIGIHVEFNVQVTCRSTSDSTRFTYDFVVDELGNPAGLSIVNDGPVLSQRGNWLNWFVDMSLTLGDHYRCPPEYEFENANTTGASGSLWPATGDCTRCAAPDPVQPGRTLVFTFAL